MANIVPSIEKTDVYYHSNVSGTFNVLEAFNKYNVKKLVYSASSSCYGIPDNYPTNETAAIRPQYPYALTKYLGEQLVMHWCLVYNFRRHRYVSLMYMDPVQEHQERMVQFSGVFLAQKLASKPFTVVGDGTQTHDFTFVSDVVNANSIAAESDIIGEIINVGSDNTYSVNQLVELLGGDIVRIPKQPGERAALGLISARSRNYYSDILRFAWKKVFIYYCRLLIIGV